MKQDNILSLLNNKYNKNETSENFINFELLMRKVSYKETKTHLVIKNFPSSFGDVQNKNNRIYD